MRSLVAAPIGLYRYRHVTGLQTRILDLHALVGVLWKEGMDTCAITARLNQEHNWVLSEAVVSKALAQWRDKRARRS